MIIELKKIDTIIVIALILIAGIVLYSAGYIELPDEQEDDPIDPIDDPRVDEPEPEPIPPNSAGSYFTFLTTVTPDDEAKHFHKIAIGREWWYYTAIFGNESDLAGWMLTISFNHMALGDLFGTLKPDMFIVTLHGPNGEEYGGVVNKERYLGILRKPTLQVEPPPGLSIKFDDSWVEGKAPVWNIHIEDGEIDKYHDLTMDLKFESNADPFWTMGSRAIQKSKSNIASYVFMGCNVTGTIYIDGAKHDVKGFGNHEHTWSPGSVMPGLLKEWDFCHIAMDNGWDLYFSNYQLRHTLIEGKEDKFSPYSQIMLTTDNGKTITFFDDVDLKVTKSDKLEDKVFLFVEMPSKITLNAKPGIVQPFLSTYNIKLDLTIRPESTYNKVWKLPTYVGMKIGTSSAEGTISWSDDEQSYEVDLAGVGNIWSMRSLL